MIAGVTPRRARRFTLVLLALAATIGGACASADRATTPPSTAAPGTTAIPGPTTSVALGPDTTAARPVPAATTVAWSLPSPWSRGVAVASGDTGIRLYSGLDGSRRSRDAVLELDPATGATRPLASLPRPLHDAAGAVLPDGTAVLVGGGEQEVGSDQVVAVTGPRSGQVLTRLPEGRSDVSAVVADGSLWVLGGYDGRALPATILRWRPGEAAPSLVGTLPVPVRYGAAAVTPAGRILVVGGTTPDGPTDAVQEVDPATGTARILGRLPLRLGHAAVGVVDGRIVLAGGRTGDARSTTAVATIWTLDPTTGSLTEVGALPAPRSDSAFTVADGSLWLLGGEDAAGTPIASVVRIG